jgi:hypothetical protein
MKNLANIGVAEAFQDCGEGADVLLSMGCTFAPGRAFRIPFTTTRSAADNPSRIAQPSLVRGPFSTERRATTSSRSITKT